MTSRAVFCLAIALNVAIMAGGIIWAKRQERRVEADRTASSYRGLFKLDQLPPPATEVQILVDDESGKPIEIEAMHWPHLGWVDAVTLQKIDEEVLGWRWHPLRDRSDEDPVTWSRERLAAELERMFPSGSAEADR